MEIRQFEAFAAVHTTGSVTAAARLLDRSQPVVSRQLQDLEQKLGFTLFVRTRPQVTLTDQGREFLEEVRNVLTGLQHLEARSREIAAGLTRPVRIACSMSLGSTLLPQVLAAMEREGNGFEYKLQVTAMPFGSIVQALQDGDADLGISSLPLELGRCQLHWSAQAPCQVALPALHPLATATAVSAAQLVDETVITMSNASRMRHRLSTALLHPSRDHSQRQIVTTSTLSAVMMVQAGLGVALVDPCVALNFPQAGVIYRPLDTYVPYVLGAFTHSERPPGAEASRIIDAVRDYAFAHIPQLIPGDTTGIPILIDPHVLSPYDDPSVADDDPTAGP